MTGEYVTNGRVALDLHPFSRRYGVHYSRVTSSTQTVAKQLLGTGETPPLVVITEEQTAGRGRLERAWTAPPFSSVLMSVALPMSGHDSAFTLKAGVAVAQALALQGVRAGLKWPNDVVVVEPLRVRKLGGMLAELCGHALVVGIGLNIDMSEVELPTADAISCAQLGVNVSRERLIEDIVDGLVAIDASDSLTSYRELCVTLGVDVAVSRIAGNPLRGKAISVDDDGALRVLDAAGAEHRVTVGDVQHVRPEHN